MSCNWCHRLIYLQKGVLVCRVCSIAAYCSPQCRNYDSPGHRLICHRETGEQVLKYAKVLIDHKVDNPNISGRAQITINGNIHDVWAFGRNLHCAVCICEPDEYVVKPFNNIINCCLCDRCDDLGLKLCPNTGLDSRYCRLERNIWSKKIMMISWLSKHHWILDDVVVFMSTIAATFLKCKLPSTSH
jgi:hypothetical protein